MHDLTNEFLIALLFRKYSLLFIVTKVIFMMSNLPSKLTTVLKPTIPSITTRRAIESKYKIDLIGTICHQIVGAKLPSNRQVLQVMFYNMRIVNLSARASAQLAVDMASIFFGNKPEFHYAIKLDAQIN